MLKDDFTPSDFMRFRRPELFPDSRTNSDFILSKEHFDFYLHTLTQRKQEQDFEHFCRRLAEKVICPNLTTQTGPTGGGDRKVDAETYPVSEQVAERYYVGIDGASKERWAFAFSTKKDWRTKVKDDVHKAVETNRGYSKIYFITNQAVRDKDGAQLEETLGKEHSKRYKVRVIILDRSWIIHTVSERNLWDLVFDCLHIDRPQPRKTISLGPLDAERQQALNELDNLIQDTDRYQLAKYQLAEDSLNAALLARGLGHSRQELDGRFTQAERIARTFGPIEQRIRILYHQAWTANFWFDDFAEVDEVYDLIEPLIIETDSVWMLEKLVQLCSIAVYWRYAVPSRYDNNRWENRVSRLNSKLQEHSDSPDKTTSTLFARTQLILMKLAQRDRGDNDQFVELLNELKVILHDAKNHLDYPVLSIAEIVEELGEFVRDDKLYDELIESVLQLRNSRANDADKGNLWLNRAFNSLEENRPYHAIEQFAKAQKLLASEENSYNLGLALVGTALSYDEAGLLWAARANFAAAANRRLSMFLKEGSIDSGFVNLIYEIISIELRLGRVACALNFFDLMVRAATNIEFTSEEKELLANRVHSIDVSIGVLSLRSSAETLRELSRFPAIFSRMALRAARGCILFALGYEDLFRSEYKYEDDLDVLFSDLVNASTSAGLPETVEWHLNSSVSMSTNIMGCEIEVQAPNEISIILVAEAILAFLESFLSTVILIEDISAIQGKLLIKLIGSKRARKNQLTSKVEEDEYGESFIAVTCSGEQTDGSTNQKSYLNGLLKILEQTIWLLFGPLAKQLEPNLAQEWVFDRARWAAVSPFAIGSLLDPPKYTLSRFIDNDFEEYSMLRSEVWKPINPNIVVLEEQSSDSFAQHRDRKILTPINVSLWVRGGWHSAGYGISDDEQLPIMMLLFEDIEDGKKIFRSLRRWLEADPTFWTRT